MTPMNPMNPVNAVSQAPTRPSGPRRTGLLMVGALVLAVGVIAAALLWFSAERRNDDAIRGLARAAVGCDTTLNFAETGTYLIFVETQGTLDDIDGTCSEGGEFAATDDVPALRVFFVDDDGVDLGIDLPRRTGVEYSGAGAVGESLRSFTIDRTGDYTLRVQSPGDGVAVAVGRDPSDGVDLLKNLAALSAVLGLIGGGILLVLGARRPRMTPAPESVLWPAATPPTSPPGMGAPVRSTSPSWQPAAGPPTTLRPPDRSPSPAPSWAAPSPSAPPQPTQWTAPSAGADNRPTPVESQPSVWDPQPPRQRPSVEPPRTERDESDWAPPSD